MNILKFSDRQLAELRQAIIDETGRRTQLAVNGHDPAAIIRGNGLAKRGMTVAAAGKHSILFVGPPNTGKTMLRAVCLDLGIEESYETRPCPCGNHGNLSIPCTCTVTQIKRWVAKFPAADITVAVCRPSEWDVNSRGTTLAEMQAAIGGMSRHTDESLTDGSANLLKAAIREMGFDLAAVARIQSISQTIANLDNSPQIMPQHVAEAVNYRPFRR